jgi:hypothetical protein
MPRMIWMASSLRSLKSYWVRLEVQRDPVASKCGISSSIDA